MAWWNKENILRGGRMKSEGTKEAFKGNHWIFLGQKTWKLVGQFHFEVQWIREWVWSNLSYLQRLMSFHIVRTSLDQLFESFRNSLSFPWCVHCLTFRSTFTLVLSRPTSLLLAHIFYIHLSHKKYFRNYLAQIIHVLMIYQHSTFLIHFTSSEWMNWRNENFFPLPSDLSHWSN